MPHAVLCVLVGSNLNVHAKPEKLGLSRDLKVNLIFQTFDSSDVFIKLAIFVHVDIFQLMYFSPSSLNILNDS